MPLFQQSVLKKYISELDKERLSSAWKIFQSNFHNPIKQQNIRAAKEEQYQEGFLRELFVDVLGYVLNPQPAFNLTTEYKNEKDSKKADGAILKAGTVRAVIELKGTEITDLSKIETQAFGYLHNQKGCTYVITSNFEKVRFYIQDATEYIEFYLFSLGRDDFDLLYLCLNADSLLADVPLEIKQQSVTQEDTITKKLYADYSTFKKALYQDLVVNNSQYDKIELFKKSQKLIDRFLFILFAEDRLLLPPNFIVKIVEEQKLLQKMRMKQSLYERFKVYFTDLLNGNKEEDIFAYNGGLFEPDEVLDSIIISDSVLQQGVMRLSQYDYNTEVDVNILGHIFEHSLNEIEELQASLENAAIDKTKTRRKKEGVFYTPRYITKYIVENTVGTLCREKKEYLQIAEEEYAPTVKKTKASEIQRKALVQKLDEYRAWLLNLTICDPACGSGAFLNAALDFLITEHRYVDELTNKLMGASIGFTWTPNDILEHNLYGVDINDEAVEIARLSLWLRTAQKGRKLSNLSSNIKVGNSVVDDKAVAGVKAFVWKKEFKEVFENGSFDVVIGNPPYVRHEQIGKVLKNSLIRQFNLVGNGTADLYVYFYQLGLQIISDFGRLGFISPNKFMKAAYGKNLRNYLSQYQIEEIIDFGELPVFSDAATFPTIFIISKSFRAGAANYLKVKDLTFKDLKLLLHQNGVQLPSDTFKSDDWLLSSSKKSALMQKIKSNSINLDSYCDGKFYRGILTGFNEAFIIDEATKNTLIKEDYRSSEVIKPFVVGEDVRKYRLDYMGSFVILMEIGVEIDNYPAILRHLMKFQTQLQKRFDKGKHWWELRACNYYSDFELPKIIYPEIAKEPRFVFDTEKYYTNNKAFIIAKNDKFLCALLNSKLIWFYLKNTCSALGDEDKGGRLELRSIYMKTIPIRFAQDQQPFIAKADIMHAKNKELHILKQSLLLFLQAKYEGIVISKKLADWPSLNFTNFLREIEKVKVKLLFAEQPEWYTYFEAEKAKAVQLQTSINQTENEIDQLVYTLYGLTEEEINIVEQV